jgi:hypothetical protein
MKSVCTLLLSQQAYVSRPSGLPRLDYLLALGAENKAWSSTVRNFLHPPVTSSPLVIYLTTFCIAQSRTLER